MHSDPMNARPFDEGELDRALDAALATKPVVPVPADFAARLALRLPQQKQTRAWVGGDGWGRHAGLLSAVAALMVMMVVVTVRDPHWLAAKGPIETALTLFLLAEVAGIALWLGISPRLR